MKCLVLDPYNPSIPPQPPVLPPTISVAIAEPTIKIVEVGSSVRFTCTARPLSNKVNISSVPSINIIFSPSQLFTIFFLSILLFQGPIQIHWSKEGGILPRERTTDDGQGDLVIISAVVSDSGTYICTATDGSSFVTERATLTVGGIHN